MASSSNKRRVLGVGAQESAFGTWPCPTVVASEWPGRNGELGWRTEVVFKARIEDMEGKFKLSQILGSAEQMPWNEALFLPADRKLSLESPCILWNLDDDENPQIAVENNLTYALGMADVQDIVANAKAQVAECTLGQLFDAFSYYMKNDAFISFA
jgi:hypothetical protein